MDVWTVIPGERVYTLAQLTSSLDWDFRNITIAEFIQGFDDCCITSLDDIINFNKKNSGAAMPDPYPNQGSIDQSKHLHPTSK
ncbi:hypothetical protein GGR55DRAFT_661987 [Xylaria sp. FL0064]|nr:hypothetical protein GGR55DRAFT_661987 [Xylaria sp. FL0064]